jgi:hypothetical protein
VIVDRPERVPREAERDHEDEDGDRPYEIPPETFLPPRSKLSPAQLGKLDASLAARRDAVGAYLVLHRLGESAEDEHELVFFECAGQPTRHDDIRPFVWSLERSIGDSHEAGVEWSVALTEILPVLREVGTAVWPSELV